MYSVRCVGTNPNTFEIVHVKREKNQTQIPKLLLHTIYPLFMLQNMYEQTYLYIYKFGVEA